MRTVRVYLDIHLDDEDVDVEEQLGITDADWDKMTDEEKRREMNSYVSDWLADAVSVKWHEVKVSTK